MSSVLTFGRVAHIPVIVDGVRDNALVAKVQEDVQRMFRHIVGRWSVSVRPCEAARGCWRLELQGGTGIHIWSFAATIPRLHQAVLTKLGRFLRSSAAAWRPSRDPAH
jgi:hypothetical protein